MGVLNQSEIQARLLAQQFLGRASGAPGLLGLGRFCSEHLQRVPGGSSDPVLQRQPGLSEYDARRRGETLWLHRWEGEGHQFYLSELMNCSLKVAARLKAVWISPTCCSKRIPVPPVCSPRLPSAPLPLLPARCCSGGSSGQFPSFARRCWPRKVASSAGAPCPHVLELL